MPATRTGRLSVPGAALHYEVRGDGPLLLVSQSGEGDANRSDTMVDHLVDAYTVVTYDRRGLSRSVLDDPARGATLDEHVDDVDRLLAHLADGPALMLGCSMGAVIGLRLARRRSERLSVLVAHEPAIPGMLPEAEKLRARRSWTRCVRSSAGTGGSPGCAGSARSSASTRPVRRPNQAPGCPFDASREANFTFFIEYDALTMSRAELGQDEIAALGRGPVRIVPAAGRTTPRQVFDYRCAEELAAGLGVAPVHFPGGHNGNLTHPKGFAELLRTLL